MTATVNTQLTHTDEIKFIRKAFIKRCGEKQPCFSSTKTVNYAYAEGLQIIFQRISNVNNAVNSDENV